MSKNIHSIVSEQNEHNSSIGSLSRFSQFLKAESIGRVINAKIDEKKYDVYLIEEERVIINAVLSDTAAKQGSNNDTISEGDHVLVTHKNGLNGMIIKKTQPSGERLSKLQDDPYFKNINNGVNVSYFTG